MPRQLATGALYRGVVPFIVIQALLLTAMILFTTPNIGPSPTAL